MAQMLQQVCQVQLFFYIYNPTYVKTKAQRDNPIILFIDCFYLKLEE